jgi:hypothetical protein
MSGALLCFTHNITTDFISSWEWPQVNVVSQSKRANTKGHKRKKEKKGKQMKEPNKKGEEL